MMSINAQQLPQQAPMPPRGMPPGYFPPHTGGNDGEREDEEQPDKRRALFGFGGGPKQPKEPEKKPRRRSRGKR